MTSINDWFFQKEPEDSNMKLDYLAALLFVVGRLKEASSYAGLAALLGALNVPNSGRVSDTIMQVGMAIAGVLAVLIPERQ